MTVETIEAGTGQSLTLKAHRRLRVIDPLGGQTCDLVAFREGDIAEWLSNGRTFDYGGTIYLTTGHTLFSNRSNPLLTILRDDAGRHDFLYAACSPESYRIQYGLDGHSNCLSNLAGALAHLGVEAHLVPTPFNIFMDARVGEDGRLAVAPAGTRPGDAIEFRAEMDLSIAISACSAPTCNGGAIKPIQFEILD